MNREEIAREIKHITQDTTGYTTASEIIYEPIADYVLKKIDEAETRVANRVRGLCNEYLTHGVNYD